MAKIGALLRRGTPFTNRGVAIAFMSIRPQNFYSTIDLKKESLETLEGIAVYIRLDRDKANSNQTQSMYSVNVFASSLQQKRIHSSKISHEEHSPSLSLFLEVAGPLSPIVPSYKSNPFKI